MSAGLLKPRFLILGKTTRIARKNDIKTVSDKALRGKKQILSLNSVETICDWITEKSPQAWEESESHLLDDDEFQDILQKCLEALPEKWNLIVKLKYLMSKKGEEICQELDIAPTNYWQMIHRAKLQLRECIETSWFQN